MDQTEQETVLRKDCVVPTAPVSSTSLAQQEVFLSRKKLSMTVSRDVEIEEIINGIWTKSLSKWRRVKGQTKQLKRSTTIPIP